jgi:hypothetical protein
VIANFPLSASVQAFEHFAFSVTLARRERCWMDLAVSVNCSFGRLTVGAVGVLGGAGLLGGVPVCGVPLVGAGVPLGGGGSLDGAVIVQLAVGGVGSTLPAGSVARTLNVWEPTVSELYA